MATIPDSLPTFKNGEPINCFASDNPIYLLVQRGLDPLALFYNVKINGTFALLENKPFSFFDDEAYIDISIYTLPYLRAHNNATVAPFYNTYLPAQKSCTAQLYIFDANNVELDSSEVFNFVKAANQIGNVYASNMADVIGVYDAPDMAEGAFLTRFPNPKFWTNFPATLSYIPINQSSNIKVGVTSYPIGSNFLKNNQFNIDTSVEGTFDISLV